MNSKKVYLFGAGASHSYKGSVSKVRPPLAKDFFKTFNKLDISNNLWVRIGNIINYVAEKRNLNVNEFSKWNEDIEAFLTEIDNNIMNELKNNYGKIKFNENLITSIRAYDQMIFLFTSVLNEIQNGSTCSNYSKVVNLLNEGDTLITFNWDTLLDKALYESGIWNIDDGYSIKFKGVFKDEWKSCSFKKKSKVKLLKLHGSTNWIMPYYSVDLNEGKRKFANEYINEKDHPIYCFHYNTKPYKTYDDRYFNFKNYAPFSYCYYPPNIPIQKPNTNNNRIEFTMGLSADVDNYGKLKIKKNIEYSMPFIIPPVKYKNYGLIDGVLNDLWNRAEENIIECNELIIVGYSFPKTDKKAWDLLKNSFNKRDGYPKITIVDPYPEGIAKRFLDEFSNLDDVNIYPITFNLFVNQYLK